MIIFLLFKFGFSISKSITNGFSDLKTRKKILEVVKRSNFTRHLFSSGCCQPKHLFCCGNVIGCLKNLVKDMKLSKFCWSIFMRYLKILSHQLYGLNGLCWGQHYYLDIMLTLHVINNWKVIEFENYFSVYIRDPKNEYPGTFVICAPYYEIIKKYLLLRPSDIGTHRVFSSLCYLNLEYPQL